MKLRAPKPKTLRAIHANRGVEAWYKKQLQCMLKSMNDSMLTHLEAAWKAAPPSVGFGQDASSAATLRKALTKWGDRWLAKYNRAATELAKKFASRSFNTTDNSLRAALADSGFSVQFKPSPGSVEAYRGVIAENVALIKSIPQQYLKAVQTGVWQSAMRGGDLGTLTDEIKAKYGIAHRRAAFIARDQNNKAKAVIENVRRQELGITHAVWQHSGGGKVPRPEHVAFSGKLFDLKKGAYLEGKWVWPGTEPNCRCTSRAVIPGFD